MALQPRQRILPWLALNEFSFNYENLARQLICAGGIAVIYF